MAIIIFAVSKNIIISNAGIVKESISLDDVKSSLEEIKFFRDITQATIHANKEEIICFDKNGLSQLCFPLILSLTIMQDANDNASFKVKYILGVSIPPKIQSLIPKLKFQGDCFELTPINPANSSPIYCNKHNFVGDFELLSKEISSNSPTVQTKFYKKLVSAELPKKEEKGAIKSSNSIEDFTVIEKPTLKMEDFTLVFRNRF